jgi:serine palmitoyltransferase
MARRAGVAEAQVARAPRQQQQQQDAPQRQEHRRRRRRRPARGALSSSLLAAPLLLLLLVVVVALTRGASAEAGSSAAATAEAASSSAAAAAPEPTAATTTTTIVPPPTTTTTTPTTTTQPPLSLELFSRLVRLPPRDAALELRAALDGGAQLASRWVAAHRPHLALEAALLLVILLVLRRDRSRPARAARAAGDGADDADDLTEREVEQLCREWRPEPLVPKAASWFGDGGGGGGGAGNGLEDWQQQGAAAAAAGGGSGGAQHPHPHHHHLPEPPSLDAWRGAHLAVVRGRECLNLASADYLALGDSPSVRLAARSTIERYGVGSCGPRGFYGTFDVHLDLEAKLADFLGCDEGIVYPYDLATLASVIPACASRADVLVLDEGCGFAIQQGALLSRARTHWFRHNDVADLARVLERADAQDGGGAGGGAGGGKGGGGNAGGGGNTTNNNGGNTHNNDDDAVKPKRRKMIVVEGVYANSGDAAPLRAIWELKERHRYRLCVDESHALGVLGARGRGACEAAGLQPGRDVEVVCGTLGAALASVGGFCVGYHEVVDPQRLSGSGYCFSASLPPYLAAAAAAAVAELASSPGGAEKAARARRAARRLRAALCSAAPRGVKLPDCACDADEEAPLLHLQASPELMARAAARVEEAEGAEGAAAAQKQQQRAGGGPEDGGDHGSGERAVAAALAARRAVERALYDVQARLISEHGVLVALPRYSPLERRLPPPSLKMHAHAGMDGGEGEGEVQRVAQAVAEACETVLGARFF